MSSRTKKTALEKAAIELQKAEEAVQRQRNKIKELTDKELVSFAKAVFKKLGRDVTPSEISEVHTLLEKGVIKIVEDKNEYSKSDDGNTVDDTRKHHPNNVNNHH